MGPYSKFIIAILWAVASFVLTVFGVDMSNWVQDTITLLVALGVFAVPNRPTVSA